MYPLLGPDHTCYCVQDPNLDNRVNKIEDYWDARYLSAGEATWWILGFHVTKKDPAVTSLPIHLPESHSNYQYLCTNDTASTLSLLNQYFQHPIGYFTDTSGIPQAFSSLPYAEYFTLFWLTRFDIQNSTNHWYFDESPPNSQTHSHMHVIQRDVMHHHLSQIDNVHPSQGELFYFHAILQSQPALSYLDACCQNIWPLHGKLTRLWL